MSGLDPINRPPWAYFADSFEGAPPECVRWFKAFLRGAEALWGESCGVMEPGVAFFCFATYDGSRVDPNVLQRGVAALLVWEPTYAGAVRWIRAGGRDYLPVSSLTVEQALAQLESLRLEGEGYEKRGLRPRRDPLTGLPEICELERELPLLLEEASRALEPLACLFIDLDHFKRVNDRFGHLAGSEALRRVATVLRNALRAEDRLYRYGGDEFVVLLRRQNESGALQAAERLRSAVELDPGGRAGRQTVSIGISVSGEREGTPEGLLEAADAALYQAKRRTRNCVETLGLRMEGAPAGRSAVSEELRSSP